jgi:hypothetical protein
MAGRGFTGATQSSLKDSDINSKRCIGTPLQARGVYPKKSFGGGEHLSQLVQQLP